MSDEQAQTFRFSYGDGTVYEVTVPLKGSFPDLWPTSDQSTFGALAQFPTRRSRSHKAVHYQDDAIDQKNPSAQALSRRSPRAY